MQIWWILSCKADIVSAIFLIFFFSLLMAPTHSWKTKRARRRSTCRRPTTSAAYFRTPWRPSRPSPPPPPRRLPDRPPRACRTPPPPPPHPQWTRRPSSCRRALPWCSPCPCSAATAAPCRLPRAAAAPTRSSRPSRTCRSSATCRPLPAFWQGKFIHSNTLGRRHFPFF